MTPKAKKQLIPPSLEWFMDWLNSSEPSLQFRELLFELTLLQKMASAYHEPEPGSPARTDRVHYNQAEMSYLVRRYGRRKDGQAPFILDQLDDLQASIDRKMQKYKGYLTFHLEVGWKLPIVDDFHFGEGLPGEPIAKNERWAMIALIRIAKERKFDKIISCLQCGRWAFRKRGATYCSSRCDQKHYEGTEKGKEARRRANRVYYHGPDGDDGVSQMNEFFKRDDAKKADAKKEASYVHL